MRKTMREKCNQKILYPVISILIPCILGIIGMVSQNVSLTIWIQNPFIIFLLTFVCMFALKYDLKFHYEMIVFISAFSLGFTFLGPNIDGVHRWLRLPFFTLNISTIIIPITIAAFYRLTEAKKYAIFYIMQHKTKEVPYLSTSLLRITGH